MTDGTGGIVDEFVCVCVGVGATVCVGVGATVGGAADGVAVPAPVAPGDVAVGPGRVCRGVDPLAEGAAEEPVEGAGDSLGGAAPPASRMTLNPASATPIASDGPRSTYRVKEARPVWPEARPPGFPSIPTPGR